ncbi:MFS transporter [Kineococcus sp. SYSU DK001]|uniref:MFS transporter n=1 Tax=Kineococcus sp. SYSU DK001 TaxID=3383122 RepID=UPI003D7DB97C
MILLLHTVLVQVVTFVQRPASTYRALELDVTSQWLGALSACFAVAPLFLALPSGALVDRWGERRTALAGGLLLLGSSSSFLLAGNSVPGLVVGNVLLGTGHLLSVLAQQALVANSTGRSGYDRSFGRYTFAASLGQALGPAVIVVLGGRAAIPDTTAVFTSTTALCLVALVVSTFLRPTRTSSAARGATAPGGTLALLRRPGMARALATSCVVLAAVDVTLAYLPALGAERGLPSALVGTLLTLRALSSMLTRLWLGRLTAVLGRKRTLVSFTALATAGIAALALPLPTWLLVVVVIASGLGLGVGQPITMSWLAETAPPGARGRAMSLRLTGNRLGQVTLPAAAGTLAGAAGASGVLLFTGAALAWVTWLSRKSRLDRPGDA